jgi:hypothetical protein
MFGKQMRGTHTMTIQVILWLALGAAFAVGSASRALALKHRDKESADGHVDLPSVASSHPKARGRVRGSL